MQISPQGRPGLFRRLFKLILPMMLVFLIFTVGSVLFYRFFPVPYTPLMAWRSTVAIFKDEPFETTKKWVPIQQISRSMQQAVIRAEDGKFYSHNGFDLEAIEKAIKYNKTHKKQKGASTISQQTAKNVFLWPSRSWLRKGMEAYYTILIEHLWSKTRILEVYLNVIELGPGVYGVEAASSKYFHKKARNLTPAESALVASVLPNPIKFKINKPSPYILRRQRKIMGRANIVKSVEKVEERKEFFDIKFDNDDEDDGVATSETTPSNE